MTLIIFIAVAALATTARVLLTADQPRSEIPWRTLGVNLTGAFLLGLVVGSSWIDNPVVVATAGLGSFTTFSTVAAETAALLDDGRRRQAIAYLGMSVVAGILAAWIGLDIGEQL